MAAIEPLLSDSGSITQKIASLVQKLMKMAKFIMPKFMKDVEEFHATLCDIANFLTTNFKASNYGAVKHSYEAIEVCQELRKMMSYCNAYMAKVNKFAWFAKREERKQAILQAFQQNDHNLAPLKDYIEQLKRSFIQAEEGSEELDKSFNGIQQRLQILVANCEKRLNKGEKKKLFAKVAGGAVATGGAVLVGGGIAMAAAAVPVGGLGGILGLLFAGAGVSMVGSATTLVAGAATYCSVEHYKKTVDATQALTSKLQLLRTISRSIQGTITDVQQELKYIKGEVEEIETSAASLHESLVNLTESLQCFFEELTESGNRCSEFYDELRQNEVLLKKAIVKVLSSELTAL